ncbi:MAG: pitrilysin family protein [Clostridia bacterium]
MVKILQNGVRIVFEENKNIRSCTVGIWVFNGSRNEPSHINGISHFIEHMMFKGTEKRSAKQIAHDMDGIGGQINAFTTKECTCYYVKALDIHLDLAIDVISDMFLNSKFDDKDIDLERTVIEEEISMYEDQPEDIVIEKLFEQIHRGSSLGFPVLGTPDTLKDINSNVMHDFVNQNYIGENIVISMCGSYSHEHMQEIERVFSALPSGKSEKSELAKYNKSQLFIEKDIEQNHICISFEGLSMSHKQRYAMQIMNGILGGGMSSRLFQKVREENGLCYSVSSFNSANLDTGIFSIYVALSKNTEKRALDLIYDVLVDLLENGITDEEFLRQREQIKANILMGLESNSSRMHFLARSVMFHNEILTSDEIIARYDAVSKEDVKKIASEIINFSKTSICVVGDISQKSNYNKFLG